MATLVIDSACGTESEELEIGEVLLLPGVVERVKNES